MYLASIAHFPARPLAGVRLSSVKRWSWRRIAARALLILGVVAFIRTFIGEAAVVPTSSMEGTILVGDHILVNKFGFGTKIPFTDRVLPKFRKVRRGDIVTFSYPKDPSLTFLKRVAAVGGDVIEIKDDIVYVNQIPVREPYAVHRAPIWQRHSNMRAARVPAGELFVLGDNRDNSDDSRYWGTVPEQNVTGEPLLILWSFKVPSKEWLSERPGSQLRVYANVAVHQLSITRWSRTGTLL
jgi:signal peptidase I